MPHRSPDVPDTRRRSAVAGEVLDSLDTDPRVLRFAGPGERMMASGLHSLDFLDGVRIISDHFDVRLYRSDELIQVIKLS